MAKGKLTEKQATKAFFVDKTISETEYQKALRSIGQSRHNAETRRKKHRGSMSSSKWVL